MWYFRLVNSIKPGSAKKINQSTMAFKCMENINVFLEAARDLGVPPQETFQTVDLWERQNLNSVVICLQSLGRKVSNSNGFAEQYVLKHCSSNILRTLRNNVRFDTTIIYELQRNFILEVLSIILTH
jgi:hypothetical protein